MTISLRIVITLILLLSPIAKIQSPTAVSHFIQSFLQISSVIIVSLIWILIAVELFAAVTVWIPFLLRKFLYPMLGLVLIFLAAVLLSIVKNLDCGCFGTLPLLSELSPIAHILLLVGLFIGIYVLGMQAKNSRLIKSETLEWLAFGAVLIVLAAFLTIPFSLSSIALSSNSIGQKAVTISAVKTAINDNSILIIDARPKFQFDLGHITGAVNIPYDSKTIADRIEKHSLRNKPLIVYCSSARCNVAHILAEKLQKLGCQNVKIYAGGWQDWRRHLD